MSELIERVARAIRGCVSADDWNFIDEIARKMYRREARAAIEAMREPTTEMLHASTMQVPTWDNEASKRKWQAMIEAALK